MFKKLKSLFLRPTKEVEAAPILPDVLPDTNLSICVNRHGRIDESYCRYCIRYKIGNQPWQTLEENWFNPYDPFSKKGYQASNSQPVLGWKSEMEELAKTLTVESIAVHIKNKEKQWADYKKAYTEHWNKVEENNPLSIKIR